MRRSTQNEGDGGEDGAALGHTEQKARGGSPDNPVPCFDTAQRYLELLGGGDVAHEFQAYYDANRKDPGKGWMARRIYGRLSDVRSQFVDLQQKGAAIAVTMAETDGRGRKSVNMLRPRAVWVEADGPLPRELPLPPSISPGKRHYIYVCRDLEWRLWHGVQQLLISEYGSDPRAGLKTQVLRLPGTLHQKNPAKPHLVRIVEEQTSGKVFTAAEIAVAFPPKSTPPPLQVRQPRSSSVPGADWDPKEILSALVAIDARLKKSGPFTARGDRPDDQAIEVDWSRYDWWFRATAAIHHASGGSDAGFELSCQVSGGDCSKGLIGCPKKFNEEGQRHVWESLSNDGSELRGAQVTIRTLYWVARRYCGWNAGRRGRPIGQPRAGLEPSPRALVVAGAGRQTIAAGFEKVRRLHTELCSRSVKGDTLKGRILEEIRARINPSTGVAGIGHLASMANTLRCRPETLRRRIRELAQSGLIMKNEGNAASMFSTSGGITIALALPESVWDTLNHQRGTLTTDPPFFAETGTTTPHFLPQAGWNPSRSPYSHVVGENQASCHPPTGQGDAGYGCHPDAHLAALWHKPNLTLDDWFDAGVVHAEVGDHIERLADERGRGAVSRVLSRLNDIRAFRKSFREIRHDVEHAADLAVKAFARKKGKRMGLTEADVGDMVNRVTPADIEAEDASDFVRELINQLEAKINQGAQGQMAAPAGQGATPDQVIWPKLTTRQSQQLKRWIQELPEVIAAHCSALARKTGFGGSVGHLVDVLEFASQKLDAVALHFVIADAARRISFQGREKPPADLAGMKPGDCLARFLRKLVTILGAEQHLPDTPGYAAIKDRARFVRAGSGPACGTSETNPGDDHEKGCPKVNTYAAARHKREPPAFS